MLDDEMIAETINSQAILFVKQAGHVYAFVDRCAHLKYPLHKGTLLNGELICGLHQWRYNAKTGEGINPKSASLKQCPIKIENGCVYVGLIEDGDGSRS
jgi:toluene monooxygenase system ferredoxin subunit